MNINIAAKTILEQFALVI